MNQFYHLRILTISFCFCSILFSKNSVFASGNADVVITTADANGSWAYSAPNHTFTPSANSATVNRTEIQNRLLGSGYTAGNIIILTACSGTGTQSGNVTTSSTITAATTSTTQYTFTITAAGSITISNAINLTPASTTGEGYPGTNIVFTGPSGVTINAALTTTGGAANSGSTDPGGDAGDITLTASSGAVSTTAAITAQGAPGGTGSGANSYGGDGGDLTFSGTSISIATGAVNNSGGAAAGTASGGPGGSITLTASSTTIAITIGITSTGGAGGTANGTPGHGGTGGTLAFTAATNYSNTTAINTTGGAGAGNGNGGVGGSITIIATAGSIANSGSATITATGGASGSSTTNQSGGNGGAITLTAGTTYSSANAISCSGGTSRGTGSSNGGAISITGPSGLTTSGAITSAYGTGGTAGSDGTLTISDGNSTITSGGANDGQTGGAYTVGAFTKTGSGNFNLSTASSWTGTTTITAGTLTLGAANIIPSTQVKMNGGTLSAGYAETMGTLMISAGSIIDLVSSNSNHQVAFAASNGVTWTASKILTIKNWSGGFNGTTGTGAIIKTGSSNELDAGHKAQIYFKNGASSYAATQISTTVTGELVPTSTLPVELISFDAEKNGDEIDVYWTTVSEKNSDYFNVRRAGSDNQWQVIGKISAAGNSNKKIDYSFIDNSPLEGINYYELEEVDIDGATQKSKITFVNFSTSQKTQLYAFPNPAINATTFDFFSEDGGIYYLKAYSLSGKEKFIAMVGGIIGENKFNLTLDDFESGIYTFALFDKVNNLISSVKVIKQ